MPAKSKTDYHRHWRHRNVHSCRISRLKYRFQLNKASAVTLAERVQGMCDVCNGRDSYRDLNVDHDHITGIVRGVLCHNCNIILGLAHERSGLLQALAEYLRQGEVAHAS